MCQLAYFNQRWTVLQMAEKIYLGSTCLPKQLQFLIFYHILGLCSMYGYSVQFSSVESLSRVGLSANP